MNNLKKKLKQTIVGKGLIRGKCLFLNLKKSIIFNFKCVLKLIIKPPFPDVQKVGFNLHLGSGLVEHKDFINVDGYPYKNIHYVRSLDNLSFCKDGSVDLVYASHCLEHFEYFRTKSVLEEWFRVLKTGGIVRISVPDFSKLLFIYNECGQDLDLILPQLFGGEDNPFNYHYIAFDQKSLTKILTEVGFKSVQTWQPGSNSLTTFNDFSEYKKVIGDREFEISLNLEAVK